MKRIHLFEFIDMPWYPKVFRRMQTDYLQYVATRNTAYQALVPLFVQALQHIGTTQIVDLCAGGTGPWVNLRHYLIGAGLDVQVTLTDKFPTPEAAQHLADADLLGVSYSEASVDALDVPAELRGMRTLFEGFHHFKPAQARAILQDAVDKRTAIGIFEASLIPPLGWLVLLLSPLMTVLAMWVLTPFIKPPRWWRFLWTYLLPVVPILISWDGVVSLLRVYTPAQLRELVASLDGAENYEWKIGNASTGTPVFALTYLVGYPVGE